jgi:SAM-dependent methyltransferase
MDQDPASARRHLTICPVCQSSRLHYLFSVKGYRIVRCDDCTLMMTNPQPSDAELGQIYGEDYFLVEKNEAGQRHVDELKQGTADLYLDMLARYGAPKGARLLEIGCGQGDFLVRAQNQGMKVAGVEYSSHACEVARKKLGGTGEITCGEITDVTAEGLYDVCALSDVIEHVRDPAEFLDRAYRLLKPDGIIFIATPTLDSWSARLLKNNWMEFKPEHLWYFKAETLQTLLIQRGFSQIIGKPCVKTLSFDYIAGHFERYPVPGITPAVKFARTVTPFPLRRKPVRVVASGMALMARKKEKPARRKLSLVVPAYNEAATFETAFKRLLAKEITDLDIEIVVVESNSTDGTRDLVGQFETHPRVKVVWEDYPQGKGHAVRAGLEQITGDFVMIQDADLEYDLEDYEALLEPLMQGRAAFVLGARHGGSAWKMRQFSGQPILSAVLNGAHWFFTMLVNVLFGAKLKDPFTMYKVFRRDCLYGLTFECDRFDFDFELVIKLLRKGYKPLEIPVNYRSRSFAEGKKVSFFRDPLTWLRALAKFRLAKLDPLDEVARQRKKA